MPALPNHQPARWPETTGWGTSWGASCSSSSAPTLPNLPQAIRLQAYDSTSDVTQPPAAVSGHKSCKVRDSINSNQIPVCTLRAHPLKRSDRFHNPSHLSTPRSVSTRYKSNLRFFPNSPPLTTNHHGGQRPPPGAPPAGPPVPQH